MPDTLCRAESPRYKPDHECWEHLVDRHASYTETHGLDCGPYEHWEESWFECTVCGEKFDPKELDEMLSHLEKEQGHDERSTVRSEEL